jgi:hypothetical protein
MSARSRVLSIRGVAASASAHWQHAQCAQLKHEPGAIDGLVGEAARLSRRDALSQQVRDGASSAQTYFNEHRNHMDYR